MTNATWRNHPGTNDYDTGSNWSGGAIPDGTAFFGSSVLHNLIFSTNTSVGGWTFKADAPHYAFHIPAGLFLEFLGAGIVIKGGSVGITNDQDLHFENQSTAGLAHITNNNVMEFNGGSTASRAHMTNNAMTQFNGGSTAGAATINNQDTLTFHGSSTAGKAHITNGYLLEFHDSSAAVSAIIANLNTMRFFDTSTAGHAHITTSGNNSLNFLRSSTAGSAVIVTMDGTGTFFYEKSTGGNARFITKAGAMVDFSGSSGFAADGILTAGSIEGAGDYFLGGNKLYVGSNNRSTTVSGAIDDGGSGIGSGSVLHKVGTGTLTLSHANNTYANGTVLTQGTLDIAAKGAAGPESIVFDAGRQTLKIENKALTNHDFGNVISFLGAGDVIDLAGLKFVHGAKATYNALTGLLKVKSGHVTDTLTLNDPTYVAYKVRDDGHGGTKIVPNTADARPLAQTSTESRASDYRAHATDTAAAVTENTDSDAQRAGHSTDPADSFQFTYLAGFADPGFHLGPDHYQTALTARGDEAAGWDETAHLDAGHHALTLSGNDFFL